MPEIIVKSLQSESEASDLYHKIMEEVAKCDTPVRITIESIRKYDDWYQYGYDLGFLDGKTAAIKINKGEAVNHGNLLSANDAYGIGYRRGLTTCQK